MQQFADSGEAENLGNVLMFRAAFDFVSHYLLSSRKSTITKQIRSEYHFLRLVGLAFLNRFSHKAAADDEDIGPWDCLRPAIVIRGNNQSHVAHLQPVDRYRRRQLHHLLRRHDESFDLLPGEAPPRSLGLLMRQSLGQDAAAAMGGPHGVRLQQPRTGKARLLQNSRLNPLVAGLQECEEGFRRHDKAPSEAKLA